MSGILKSLHESAKGLHENNLMTDEGFHEFQQNIFMDLEITEHEYDYWLKVLEEIDLEIDDEDDPKLLLVDALFLSIEKYEDNLPEVIAFEKEIEETKWLI